MNPEKRGEQAAKVEQAKPILISDQIRETLTSNPNLFVAELIIPPYNVVEWHHFLIAPKNPTFNLLELNELLRNSLEDINMNFYNEGELRESGDLILPHASVIQNIGKRIIKTTDTRTHTPLPGFDKALLKNWKHDSGTTRDTIESDLRQETEIKVYPDLNLAKQIKVALENIEDLSRRSKLAAMLGISKANLDKIRKFHETHDPKILQTLFISRT